MLLTLSNVKKTYWNGNKQSIILKNVNLQIKNGEVIAIKGRSGSGKTSLLNIIAGLTKCDSGQIHFNYNDITNLSFDEQLEYRRKNISIITQQFNLLDDRSVFENIALPLNYEKVKKDEKKKKVQEVLNSVGMKDFAYQKTLNLSGGERQRIAIARALVKEPLLLIADEPTGSLDVETEKGILGIIDDLKDKGVTIIIVTHDDNVANICDTVYELVNGELHVISSSIK
ncbi:ABC transporter ATP-binding protein [Lysinibacillus tabacifolii]|uniref:ABC transporter ATP-binding protein n=1 Tax=Lysinibacillus tabacifolii TaxID=1173107 RepID=A0ABY2SWB6_9BACI|nr:ABC transporter ATP-binding protein [Lysinibacillus tabacifolii]TKI46643.1 ABC transporter ATP-binding protein [Lysinibacillus tabacifolii]